jgi:4'-phosphopantetheinyl transferase
MSDEAFAHALKLLDGPEQARAARFRSATARRRFVAARAFLRQELGAHLGVAPAQLDLIEGQHGKPGLRDGSTRFNLSHTDDVAVLAICEDMDVGVDVERERTVAAGVATLIMSDAERRMWDQRPPEARAHALICAWTRKEAVLKALGTGFQLSPRMVEVSDAAEGCVEICGTMVTFADLACPPGHVGAIARVASAELAS